jgi:hypothetical protein
MQPARRRLPRIASVVSLLVALLAAAAEADCAKDLHGEVWCGAGRCASGHDGIVWCSRFDDGGAVVTRFDGAVLCGPGACAKNLRGEAYCSAVPGGAVTKDSRGRVRCEGRCVAASADHCESERADAAG